MEIRHGGTVVNLHRLTPTSLLQAKTHYGGRCSACEKPVKHRDRVVHLYGELFHHDCAFYRPIGKGAGRTARSRPA
jgi:hypothetical protein